MKKYLLLLSLLLAGLILVTLGLDLVSYSQDPLQDTAMIGSEAWCESLAETPADQWRESDYQPFADHCLAFKK